ncbi:MAG TPA: tetratricopeptide repeat protein [Terriglobia bacterium]|nr:tetratricopeptide repeat protein [Terriglobia bacterium]
MRMTLSSNLTKFVALALEAAAFLALAIWVGKTYAADLVAHRLTVPELRLATRLDPSDSDYHLKLGRSLQYEPENIDPEGALAELRRAVALNPDDAEAWVSLAGALQLQGESDQAAAALSRTDFLAPSQPGFQWAVGNFLLLHGQTEDSFRHFKAVLAGTRDYDGPIFNIAWKASGDASTILAQLIPAEFAAENSYLSYLVGNKKYPEAEKVWDRIAAERQTFDPRSVSGYLDALVGIKQPAEAYSVWSYCVKRGLLSPTESETPQNLVINGDFEDGLLNMGFDWRIYAAAGVDVSLDRTTFHSGAHSLLLRFPGNQNPYYGSTFQMVRVEPDHLYHLRAFMKTEGITTDSGPRIEVRDYYDPRALDLFSASLLGTTPGWSQIDMDVKTGPKTELVGISVSRLPSEKIDSLIAGKVWVDDVKLTPASEPAIQGR